MPKPLFLYHYTYEDTEIPLAELFFSYLFPNQAFDNFVLSENVYELSQWLFLQFSLEILSSADDYESFKQSLCSLNLQDWHLSTWHYHKDFSFNQRISITKELANLLANEGRIRDYQLELMWAFWAGKWYLGKLSENRYPYKARITKPYQYSHALPVRLCQQLIQLLNFILPKARIVDPCAGSGTMVIEGLVAGVDIIGYEINPQLAQQANENLAHFGFPPLIVNCDALTMTNCFDVSILDIPYGLYTPVDPQLPRQLIAHCQKISTYLLLISSQDYRDYLTTLNYTIVFFTQTHKAKFTRFLTLVKK